MFLHSFSSQICAKEREHLYLTCESMHSCCVLPKVPSCSVWVLHSSQDFQMKRLLLIVTYSSRDLFNLYSEMQEMKT